MKESLKMAYDVIVVGAGPAGSIAAKRCVEQGLRTLILEKRRLPRDKVCSGMIMGPVAHAIIKEELGDLPNTVLTQPSHLSGYFFHVPGIGSEKLDNFTRLTWRRNLDYWMVKKAQASGVEVWEGALVVNITQQTQGFSVAVKIDEKWQELWARFVVGADGGNSTIRRLLFPKLKIRYAQVYQEHYHGEMDLDKNYFHWFYPPEYSPEFFDVHQKDGLIIVDVGGRIGKTDNRIARTKDFLAQNYHFDSSQKPVWMGSCLQPVIYPELTSHTFKPALGNALLVGDAAGLVMPVSGEGIGTGMKSALLAANSIKRAIESGEPAAAIYLSEIGKIISMFGELYPCFKRIVDEAKNRGRALPKILRDSYLKTLRTF
jgi:flavin-dependent dehydrogenase